MFELVPISGNSFELRVDGEAMCRTHADVLQLYPELHGDGLSGDEVAMFVLASTLHAGVMNALQQLARRSLSSVRLTEVIRDKTGIPESAASLVVAMFGLRGYINDYELARGAAFARLRRKAVGPKYIQRFLMQKLFPRHIIEQVLKELYTEYDEDDLAYQALTLRYGAPDAQNNPALAAKFSLFLSQRGFGYSSVSAACRRYRQSVAE